MSNQSITITPILTVDEAEQTLYNLDEVIQALHIGEAGVQRDTPEDLELITQIQFVLSNVQSTRNKLHTCLQEAGISLDYKNLN